VEEGVLQWLLFYVYLDGGMDFVVDYFQGRESYYQAKILKIVRKMMKVND
jgi:hypothetical protein